MGSGFFSIVQTIFAQTPTWFLVTNTQNTWNYITTGGYGTINFSWTELLSLFERSWNNLPTTFYELKPSGNTIYFNNFDTPEVLEQNQVPLADSIRDFTGGTNWEGQNGWKYFYKSINPSWEGIVTYPYVRTRHTLSWTCDILPPATEAGIIWTEDLWCSEFLLIRADCVLSSFCQMEEGLDYHCSRECVSIESWFSIETTITQPLTFSFWINLRTIWTGPIVTHNFANIGERDAHPWSGTVNSLSELSWSNNIPVIQQRTSNLSGKIKIINKIADDNNNCWNGIRYKIYTGTANTITGIFLTNNFTEFTIEKEINIKIGDTISFEINNSWDNQCDGTWNWIQIYDITDNAEITGWPSYTENGKYWWALNFTGNQQYSLGTGINQSTTDGITIAAWINTRDKNQSQGIITKKFSYGIVLKQWTLRISPSTYWMRHDTGIPIDSNTRTHVAWTYDGSTMRAYKNGSQIRTYNINWELNNNESEVMIGYDELNQRWRNGRIDEFRMYDTTFTTGQIQELYESNLKLVDSWTNSSWNFIINKTGLVDGIYNYEINWSISEITWSILVDQNWPILTGQGLRSVEESQHLTLTTTRYDSGMSKQLTGWFDRGRWWDIYWIRDIATNTWNNMNFWREEEPIQKQIKVRIIDHVGNISYKTGIISWWNTWPVISDPNDTYTWLVEDNITFFASGYDTGSSLFYQRYSWLDCSQIITGATQETYTTGSDSIYTWNFSYKIFDQQGSWSLCKGITGIWEEPNISEIISSNNINYTDPVINWTATITEDIFSWGTIIYSGNIGTCELDEDTITYTSTGIGNDYCIVNTLLSWYIVIWWYNINRYTTIYQLTWTKINPYIINKTTNPFIIDIQNTNLTWFTRSLSWRNTNISFDKNIYWTWLIWFYNFDKILIADSEKDFMPIQSGKNRSYLRRPRWTQNLTWLQYYHSGQQRIISTPIETYDWFFIEKDELNPGYNYGDAVLWWTSPINATIEIDYTLQDANTSCWDGIQYKLTKNWSTEILATGNFESKIITTQISSWDTIYLIVNSLNNNECDNTNYNIKIYQLPETNLWTTHTFQGINSWAIYTTGKYNWALDFTNNKYITLGTGIQSSRMSISAWIYKWAWDNQTIIQKRWSYGIVIYNNKLQVTNQNTIRRYNTQISIPENTWTHIWRSYDGTGMKVYINGNEQRSWIVLGTIPNNNNQTYVGRSVSNRWRNGLIDELYIYNYAINKEVFSTLYEHNLNKISRDKRTRTSNNSWSVYDGRFYFTGITNNRDIKSREFIRDFNPPIFTGIIWLTWWESNNLTITGFVYDNWSIISWYQFRYKLSGDRNSWTSRTENNIFIIPAENESISWNIEIKVQDWLWNETIGTGIIQRLNTWPIVPLQTTTYLGNVWQNIEFIASGYDIWGGPLSYQWYTESGCDNNYIITGQTGYTFNTGRNSISTLEFSYKIFDKQGSDSCSNVIGNRSNDIMFTNYTLYVTGNEDWSLISGNWSEISEIATTSWKQIINQAKYGTCILTGTNKEIIHYMPNTWSQENDSCIIELIDTSYLIAAFTNVNTQFIYSRTPNISSITQDTRNISRTSKISIPTITSFTGKRDGETLLWSWLININTDNLIRKYSFDKILITDSTTDFWYFQTQNGRRYLWNNWTSNGELVFNPKTKNRIINEPLQDYEYIFINSWKAYPGATKYGNIIYERTSNSTGNITIETTISNANAPSCSATNGIYYSIIKWTWQTIYTKDIPNLTEIVSTGTYIQSWDTLKFIIDGNGNNQCDKINFNVKIYQNSTNDYSLSGQNLTGYWATTINNWKYFWSYTFWPTPHQYIDIGNIKQKTGLSFSTRIKTTATTNQTLIYKPGSYWLTIRDWILSATTDWWRRYPTNTNTTDILTNWSRNHLVRTYNGTNMYIYLNGQQTRSGRIVWYYPLNDNPTIIGRSNQHGQFDWSIDEFQVRNKFIDSNETKNLYHTQLSKIDAKNREFSLIQTGLADGIYTFTWYINNTDIITWSTIIDNDPPILQVNTLYTGNEATGINISISGWDNGIWIISGYEYSRIINNSNPATWATGITWRITSTWIIIPAQNEPTTGTLTIKAKDSLWHQTGTTTIIQRLNTPITTEALYQTTNEATNIIFTASGYDQGWTTNTGYQRYSWDNCTISITGANQKTFTTGRNEPFTGTFSYRMFDAQWLSGMCAIATGIRINIAPIAQDIYVNASWNQYITFAATGSDPGATSFSGQWYEWTTCTGNILGTWLSFTTGSEKSGTRWFSYHLRDAQNATGKNNTNSSRDCQIATWYWPYINPIANDFDISTATANNLITWDRKSASQARDPEFNTPIIANISSWAKWHCQIINNLISFQPMANEVGTGFCELTLTDGNNRSTKIKAYAKNIDTTPPSTIITGTDYTYFKLLFTDTSLGTSNYKILTGVWNVWSCWTSEYTPYISWSEITLVYTPGITDYRTVCYYSIDEHGNKETTKSQLFTQPQDAVPFIVSSFANEFMNTIFEATITTNKTATGTLTGLDTIKTLSFTPGTHTITGNYTENNWQKTVYITLQTQNTGEIFTRSHTFTIDQNIPTTPIITENIENTEYYIIKRTPSTDDISGIKWYNYQIDNQYTTIKTGFTDVTYINILKSEVQYNNRITIKVQAQDKVNNFSPRSNPRSITIVQQQPTTNIDTTPNQFSFVKTTNAKRNTLYTSNEIVIWGLSSNTVIPIALSTGTLFINDTKITGNSWTVKNWDIVYIQLYSSNTYNESNYATLIANWISSTYTITTESTIPSSTTSFLDEIKRILEKIQQQPATTWSTTTDTNIDNTWISAPHIAPNGKVYNLYKTIDGRYSAHNFVIKKYFTSLSEMKTYIDKNNPR